MSFGTDSNWQTAALQWEEKMFRNSRYGVIDEDEDIEGDEDEGDEDEDIQYIYDNEDILLDDMR